MDKWIESVQEKAKLMLAVNSSPVFEFTEEEANEVDVEKHLVATVVGLLTCDWTRS